MDAFYLTVAVRHSTPAYVYAPSRSTSQSRPEARVKCIMPVFVSSIVDTNQSLCLSVCSNTEFAYAVFQS